MKKPAFTFTTFLLLGALVFAGGCRGEKTTCVARNAGAKAVAVVPHVGTNAFAVIYQDYTKSERSAAVNAFTALLERKQREFNDAVSETRGDVTLPEAVRKYTDMTSDEMFRFIYRDYTRQLDIHMTTLLFDLVNQAPCTPEEFAYLQGRVLLILPENDDSFTPEMQKDLIDMMPDSVIVEGIDSGHISTLLEVDRYVEEILRFLEG